MSSHVRNAILLFAVLTLAACAGPNPLLLEPVHVSQVSGFFGGVWHGFVLPFSFIGSLFTDSISLYAVQNTGGWYDFGYVIGVVIMFKVII